VIITFCVQNVHRSAGRYTSLQSLAAVFHCSVINGFIAEGRSDQLQYVFQLGNYFWLWLQLPALPPNVIIQWIVSTGDLRATYRWWWSRCSLTSASPLWRLTGKAERRLAGRWNHSALQLFSLPPVLATKTVFQVVCCDYLRLLIHEVQMPFSADAHSLRHHGMTGKLFPFNEQLMRLNVSFTSTSPHSAILVTDGWILTKVLLNISVVEKLKKKLKIGEEDMFGFTFP